LLRRSIDNAPALLEQAANVRHPRGCRQAHAWANPTVGVEFENIGGSSAGNSPSTPQTTFSITQPLELAKRGPRIAAGEASVRASEARGTQVRFDYAAQLALAYATAEAMQLRLQLAQEDVARAEQDLKAANALVEAGKEARLRAAQAQAGLSSARAAREDASANLTVALADLSALAGVAEPYTGVPSSLLATDSVPATVMGPDIASAPAIMAAQAERDAVAAQVRVERSKAVPDLGLSGGIRRFGGSRETGLVLGVTASIPLFNRNSGGIAAAEARRDAAEERLAATRLASDAARRGALAQISASAARLNAATEGEAAAGKPIALPASAMIRERRPCLNFSLCVGRCSTPKP
jgi:cobalt-zinc-cadmium efflux system outer membrane protein